MPLTTREWDKDPADIDYRTFDFLEKGFLEEGETIVGTPAWDVPSGSGLTQPFVASNTTTTVTIWLANGTINETRYRVKCTIVTSLGRQKIVSWRVLVREE